MFPPASQVNGQVVVGAGEAGVDPEGLGVLVRRVCESPPVGVHNPQVEMRIAMVGLEAQGLGELRGGRVESSQALSATPRLFRASTSPGSSRTASAYWSAAAAYFPWRNRASPRL